VTIDSDDEFVLAERGHWKGWKVRGNADVLIIADCQARGPADVKCKPRMQRLHHVWHDRDLNRLSIFADEFYFHRVLLVRLAPRHSDHDADAQVYQVRRRSPGRHIADLDTAGCDVQQVVHCLRVVAEDCIDLHAGSVLQLEFATV